MTGMIRIVIAAAAAVLLPHFAARAAELPVTTAHHRVVTHRVHRLHVSMPQRHFGYYFGGWGWRSGGSARSWYGSTFLLAGGPGEGPGLALAASRKGIASIRCREGWPHVCVAKPLLAPVAVAAPLAGW